MKKFLRWAVFWPCSWSALLACRLQVWKCRKVTMTDGGNQYQPVLSERSMRQSSGEGSGMLQKQESAWTLWCRELIASSIETGRFRQDGENQSLLSGDVQLVTYRLNESLLELSSILLYKDITRTREILVRAGVTKNLSADSRDYRC